MRRIGPGVTAAAIYKRPGGVTMGKAGTENIKIYLRIFRN